MNALRVTQCITVRRALFQTLVFHQPISFPSIFSGSFPRRLVSVAVPLVGGARIA